MSLNLKAFHPGWRITVFVLCFLPLTVSLGFWQLSRAEFKENMQAAYLNSITQLPVEPGPTLQDFQRVRLTGPMTMFYYLVENQVRDGEVGYWVVQSFIDLNDRIWLINRGFFGQSGEPVQGQVSMPDAQEEMTLVGVVWPNTGLVPLLADEPVDDPWPKVRQRLDIEKFAIDANAEPYEIRLEESEWAPRPAPFTQVMSADTHYGYAATWFGLAMALTILYITLGVKSAKEKEIDGRSA